MVTIPWNIFHSLANNRNSHQIEGDLSQPGRIQWPETQAELTEARRSLLPLLSGDQQILLDLSLLCHLLLNPRTRSKQWASWIKTSLDTKLLLNGCPLSTALAGFWQAVPVVTAQPGRSASMVYFLVGAIAGTKTTPFWPYWVDDRLDQTARTAIKDAFRAAGPKEAGAVRRLYTIPILSPQNGPLVEGRSLGLSLALAAHFVLCKTKIPRHFLATGDVTGEDGQVLPVDGATIASKAEHAQDKDFSLFLFPRDNHPLATVTPGMEQKPVGTLKQAWLWAARYEPGNAREIQRLETALQDARCFVDNCGGLASESLDWCRETGELDNFLPDIMNNQDLLKRFMDRFADSLKKGDGLAHAIAMSRLIQIEDMDVVANTSPLAAFEWCRLNSALANHAGNVRLQRQWHDFGARHEGSVRNSPEGRRRYSSFINHHLGSGLHNQYLFQSEFPVIFKDVLKQEERVYKIYGRGPDYVLGSLYGAMAQNYAFYGKKYLKEVGNYVRKAQKKFGGGLHPDFELDWRRGFSCLFGAYMDAEKFVQAQKALWNFMDADSWNCFLLRCEEPKFAGPHRSHAYYFLARFLADAWGQGAGHARQKAIAAGQLLLSEYPGLIHGASGHPWQLFAYNMGRLALLNKNQDLARQAFEMSIILCEQGGETMKVMVLLPLAALYVAGPATEGHIKKAGAILDLIRTSDSLNQGHFQALLDAASPDTALALVAAAPGRFFPFLYR